ncbi:MAG: phospholipase A [Steroidobacteraceae bacterium]
MYSEMDEAVVLLMKRLSTLLLCLFASCAQAETLVFNLLTSGQPAAGAPISVELLAVNIGNEDIEYQPPVELPATLHGAAESWSVNLQQVTPQSSQVIAAGRFARVAYALSPPPEVHGRVELEIEQYAGVRTTLELSGPADSAAAKSAIVKQDQDAAPVAANIERSFSSRFGFHEPVYFLYGLKAPTAKFQFSFKYRLIGKDGALAAENVPLRGLYFAYTQRSLWDVDRRSSPFYDTSYMPEVFYEWLGAEGNYVDGGFHWLGVQSGIQHESNGKDGDDSRSLNVVEIRTGMVFGSLAGWHLLVTPRVYKYLDATDDLPHYRGYGDLQLTLEKSRGTRLDVTTRAARFNGRGSMQLDLTQPLSISSINFRAALQFQYFNGYGESLRSFNQKTSVWRVGLNFVR